MCRTRPLALAVLATLLIAGRAASLTGQEPAAKPAPRTEDLLQKILDENTDVRFSARALAPQVGAPAVVPLGELLVHSKRESARTARAALERLVHHTGRPGAEAERGPVVKELARLLEPGRPAAIQREALYLIACIGGDDAVGPVARLLDSPDPVVREQARLSLERLPGQAALKALLAAAQKSAEPDLLYSLAKKGDPSVATDLIPFATHRDVRVRLSALEALARLGAADAVPVFSAEIGRAAEEEKARVVDEALRLADNLSASSRQASDGLYRRALAEAPLDHQREHALGALCAPGSREALPLLIAGLADRSARVRRLAGQRLGRIEGPEALSALREAYLEARGEARALLLLALADRSREAAQPHLEKAAAESSPDLKVVALDILDRLDDPAMEPVYLRAAESGPDWLRARGLRGYLVLARRKAGQGGKNEALPMFVKVLDLAKDPEPRREALKGLVDLNDVRSMGRLEALVEDPQLGHDAARGYLKLAEGLGKAIDAAAAEKHLMAMARSDLPREIRERSVEVLRGMGVDPQREAHQQGFVVDWHVITPMGDRDGKRLEQKDFPEEVIEIDREQREGERRYRWQKVAELSPEGKVNLITFFRRTENVITYAYTEIDSPAEREVLFKMGSDDGIACWLNGERIHLKNLNRGYKVDEDTVKARLTRGKNKVLLKISQKDGDWAFSFRMTDTQGKPIDLSAAKTS